MKKTGIYKKGERPSTAGRTGVPEEGMVEVLPAEPVEPGVGSEVGRGTKEEPCGLFLTQLEPLQDLHVGSTLKDENDIDADLAEAEAILRETHAIRADLRQVLASKPCEESDSKDYNKENEGTTQRKDTTSPNLNGQEEAKSESELDRLLSKRNERQEELREHMEHLHGPGEDGEALIEFPEDFSKMVAELFKKSRDEDEEEEVLSSSSRAPSVQSSFTGASSEKIHAAIAEGEANGEEVDLKLQEGMKKVDKLDKRLAKVLEQAEKIARETYPEKYANLDAKRKEQLEKKISDVIEKERKEQERKRELARVLSGADAPPEVCRLSLAEEKLVESILNRSEADEEENPFEIEGDSTTDERSEAQSSTGVMSRLNDIDEKLEIYQAEHNWDAVSGTLADFSSFSSRPPTAMTPATPPRSVSTASNNALQTPTSSGRLPSKTKSDDDDYISMLRVQKEEQKKLKDIDDRLVQLKISEFPDRLSEEAMKELLDECKGQINAACVEIVKNHQTPAAVQI